MSINRSHAPNGDGVILFYRERIIIFYGRCSLKLSCFKESLQGKVYLTSHRCVFINKKSCGNLLSWSVPFIQIKSFDIEQPVFGANRIVGKFAAEPDGGLQGDLEFRLTFNDGGAIEFGKALDQLHRLSVSSRGIFVPPPPYTETAVGANQLYACPPPAYEPPYGDPYYGFVQHHQAFSTPEANSLFYTTAPPPYPGAAPIGSGWSQQSAPVEQNGTVFNAPQQHTTINQSGTGNAVTSGYYFQENSHVLYVPPSAPPQNGVSSNIQPPPYPTDNQLPPYPVDKKYQ